MSDSIPSAPSSVSHTDVDATASPDECPGCELGRRAFLRDGARAAVAFAALHALPVRFVTAIAAHGNEATYAIPTGDSVSIDRDKDLILVRVDKSVYTFVSFCPHQNTLLRWIDADKRFQCPKHKSRYTADGVYIEGRATRSMDRYAIRRDGNNVIANLDLSYESDRDVKQWKEAVITV